MRILRAWLTTTALALSCAGQPAAAGAPCSARAYGEARLTPDNPHPARLSAVRKVTWVRGEPDMRPLPQPSPDGRAFFVVRRGVGLQLGPDPEGAPPQVVALPEIADAELLNRRPAPFAWAKDSRAVFAASQAHMRPRGGWALEGLQPLRIWRDGRIEPLPALRHPAGELDGLFWAGGAGLALAEFGTHGGLYRPERKNPDPAFAFVDAAHGKVLASVPFSAIPGVTPRREGSDYALFDRLAVTVRPDGKLRALVRLARGPWVILDQGKPPRVAPIPKAVGFAGVALSADGARVLVTPDLQPSGPICEHNPNCPAATPVEGAFAAMYDLESGKRLWELRGTAVAFWTYPDPALSADGALALVGPPGKPQEGWPQIAVVSARTGAVVQTLCAADSSSNGLAFLPNGQMALGGVAHVAVYDLEREGR
jgi:hypothetical protein